MAGTKQNAMQTNLKEIAGHPGLYTFITVSRDPRKEKALLRKVSRDAKKLGDQSVVARAFAREAD